MMKVFVHNHLIIERICLYAPIARNAEVVSSGSGLARAFHLAWPAGRPFRDCVFGYQRNSDCGIGR